MCQARKSIPWCQVVLVVLISFVLTICACVRSAVQMKDKAIPGATCNTLETEEEMKRIQRAVLTFRAATLFSLVAGRGILALAVASAKERVIEAGMNTLALGIHKSRLINRRQDKEISDIASLLVEITVKQQDDRNWAWFTLMEEKIDGKFERLVNTA